jgi:hypothetical protein
MVLELSVACGGCNRQHVLDSSRVLDPRRLDVLKRCSYCFGVYYCNAECKNATSEITSKTA